MMAENFVYLLLCCESDISEKYNALKLKGQYESDSIFLKHLLHLEELRDDSGVYFKAGSLSSKTQAARRKPKARVHQVVPDSKNIETTSGFEFGQSSDDLIVDVNPEQIVLVERPKKISFMSSEFRRQSTRTPKRKLYEDYIQTVKEEIISDDEATNEKLTADAILDSSVSIYSSLTQRLNSSVSKNAVRTARVRRGRGRPKKTDCFLPTTCAYNTVFGCFLCSFSHEDKTGCVRHLQEAHPEYAKLSRCTECSFEQSFNVEGTLLEHGTLHLLTLVQCGLCRGLLFDIHEQSHSFACKVVDISSHYRCIADESHLPSYRCSDCSLVFRTYTAILNHVSSSHLNTEETRFTCSLCGSTLKSFTRLINHLNSHIKGRKVHRCATCDLTFEHVKQLQDHRREKHAGAKVGRPGRNPDQTNVKPILCSECGEAFESRFRLKRHRVAVHFDVGKIRFECDICNAEIKSKRKLYLHMREHKRELPDFRCEECDLNFRGRNAKNKHDVEVHNVEGIIVEIKRYACPKCKRTFGKQSRLDVHINNNCVDRRRGVLVEHKNNNEANRPCPTRVILKSKPLEDFDRMFSCPFCPTVAMDWKLLIDHIASHSDVVDFKQNVCPFCTYVQEHADDSQVIAHFATHIPKVWMCRDCSWCICREKRPAHLCKTEVRPNYGNGYIAFVFDSLVKYKCKSCEFLTDVFQKQGDRNSLVVHLRSHSGNDIECDVCGKVFGNEKSLKVHRAYAHVDWTKGENADAGRVEFPCEECGKMFPTQLKLRRHTKDHKKYRCQDCGKDYSGYAALWAHQKALHKKIKPGSRVSCNVCGKQFMTRLKLQWHINTHTGERPYQCHLCSNSYKEPTHLKRHLQWHSGVKRFTCEHCGKSFLTPANYKNHKMLHTGERPFVCSVCNKGFIVKRDALRHMQRHHKGMLPENVLGTFSFTQALDSQTLVSQTTISLISEDLSPNHTSVVADIQDDEENEIDVLQIS